MMGAKPTGRRNILLGKSGCSFIDSADAFQPSVLCGLVHARGTNRSLGEVRAQLAIAGLLVLWTRAAS